MLFENLICALKGSFFLNYKNKVKTVHLQLFSKERPIALHSQDKNYLFYIASHF
jgi:hypothetical protein